VGTLADIQTAEAHIRAKVRMVVTHEQSFGVLSTGERIAVAIVLDRYDLVQRGPWGTMIEAAHQLAPQWIEAALRVQRRGWDDEAQ
jgi:selenocysteine-specific translation elongation factor